MDFETRGLLQNMNERVEALEGQVIILQVTLNQQKNQLADDHLSAADQTTTAVICSHDDKGRDYISPTE